MRRPASISGAIHKGGLYRCDEGSISVTTGSETRTLTAGEEVLVDYDLGRFVDDDTQPPPGGNCNNGCSQTGGSAAFGRHDTRLPDRFGLSAPVKQTAGGTREVT
jgi:hypothetical protein